MLTYPPFSPSDLPDETKPRMFFYESSFFKDHCPSRSLPSPAEVRVRSKLLDPRPLYDPKPVKFEELNLLVKFGPSASTCEALSLWAVGKIFDKQVPVPEVYGWDTDEQDVFIYMQLIRGPTLQERYDSLSYHDKQSICQDLRMALLRLRAIRQCPSNQAIGSITLGPLRDRVVEYKPDTGPFPDIKAFHDWLSWLWRRRAPEPEEVLDPWREFLPDDGPIVLTHADLHPSNIMITNSSPAKLLAIVDWEQAGWYPEYWEYCKATWSVGEWEDWRSGGWVDSFLEPHPNSKEAWSSTCNAFGAF